MLNMSRSLLLSLLLCGGFSLFGAKLHAASADIEKAVEIFEKGLENAFSSGKSALDRFQQEEQRKAIIVLNKALVLPKPSLINYGSPGIYCFSIQTTAAHRKPLTPWPGHPPRPAGTI